MHTKPKPPLPHPPNTRDIYPVLLMCGDTNKYAECYTYCVKWNAGTLHEAYCICAAPGGDDLVGSCSTDSASMCTPCKHHSIKSLRCFSCSNTATFQWHRTTHDTTHASSSECWRETPVWNGIPVDTFFMIEHEITRDERPRAGWQHGTLSNYQTEERCSWMLPPEVHWTAAVESRLGHVKWHDNDTN